MRITSNFLYITLVFVLMLILALTYLINIVNKEIISYGLRTNINLFNVFILMMEAIVFIKYKKVYIYDKDITVYNSFSIESKVILKSDLISLTRLFFINDKLNYRLRYIDEKGKNRSIYFLSTFDRNFLKNKLEIKLEKSD